MRALVAPAEAIFLDAKLESELVELPEDEAARAAAVGRPGRVAASTLARVGFDTLGLQTYLTAGPKEARAWTIRKGATAPEAAGVIHTDFQRGFIKAEVVGFADLVALGSMAEAKAEGQGAHRGQGLRHGRRRRRGVPLQRLSPSRLVDREGGTMSSESVAPQTRGVTPNFSPRLISAPRSRAWKVVSFACAW